MDPQDEQIYKAIIIGLIVILSVAGYFISSVIKNQKRLLEFQRKNAGAEIASLERDRSRIAVDLHDEMAPMLSAVKMKINSFDLNNAEDEMHLNKTNGTIDNMARRMREISFDLMPQTLLSKGLKSAVNEFCNFITQKQALIIHVNYSEENFTLDENQLINCYRILQEIVHNTIKHAKASELIISLKQQKNKFIIRSSDNGMGFNHHQMLLKQGGLGLKSLSNRVHVLQGEMFVESNPGKGTVYTIEIPLK
jgi:two-component system, NarL family, sensor kinase